LWICAALVERGVTAVAVLLAGATVGSVALTGLELPRHWRDDPEFWGGAAGLAVFCIPAWLAVRAVGASRRLAGLGRRPRTRSSTARKLRSMPRDARLAQSLGPFVIAYAVWGAGALAALGVAIIVPFARGLLAGLTFLLFALGAGKLFDYGRRRLALRLEEVRARDPRQPLLLLRSFADDNLPLERRFSIFGNLLQRPFTLEELVVDRLWSVGPVMAIGSPGETLSPAGAAREYVPDAEWQGRLLSGLDECGWVIGILGSSASVMWEFRQVHERGAADRFLLVFPPHAAPIIGQRWEALSRSFPSAAGVMLPTNDKVDVPLAAVFPSRAPAVLYCCKYRNETAYAMALEEIVSKHMSVAAVVAKAAE
jgi:hypothetical protein